MSDDQSPEHPVDNSQEVASLKEQIRQLTLTLKKQIDGLESVLDERIKRRERPFSLGRDELNYFHTDIESYKSDLINSGMFNEDGTRGQLFNLRYGECKDVGEFFTRHFKHMPASLMSPEDKEITVEDVTADKLVELATKYEGMRIPFIRVNARPTAKVQ